MSDLIKWLRLKAVEERVSVERQKTAIAESKSGKIEGVSVDESRGRILVDCVVKPDGEIVIVAPVIKADFFRISVVQSARGPRIAVVSNGREVRPFLKETRNGQRLLIFAFRNGVIIRCWEGQRGAKVIADYVATRRENGKPYLLIYPKFEVGIPRFAAEGDLRQYLQAARIPEEFLGIVTRLVDTRIKGQILNPVWIEGLEKAKVTTRVTPITGVDVSPSAKADSTRKERRRH